MMSGDLISHGKAVTASPEGNVVKLAGRFFDFGFASAQNDSVTHRLSS